MNNFWCWLIGHKWEFFYKKCKFKIENDFTNSIKSYLKILNGRGGIDIYHRKCSRCNKLQKNSIDISTGYKVVKIWK